MRAKEIVSGARLWSAKIKVTNPTYTGYIDAQVWAPNANLARQLFKSQFRIEDHHVGSVKQVR
jgi:hypothetical protein